MNDVCTMCTSHIFACSCSQCQSEVPRGISSMRWRKLCALCRHGVCSQITHWRRTSMAARRACILGKNGERLSIMQYVWGSTYIEVRPDASVGTLASTPVPTFIFAIVLALELLSQSVLGRVALMNIFRALGFEEWSYDKRVN